MTLPLLSSNDEIVGLLTTQTLQNKIINVNNNTLKHGITNAIGDLLVGTGTKYDRLAMGSTGGYVLAIKSDLTGLEWVSAPGGGTGETNTASNVGTAGVGVFKLKSGVNLQFKKINAASGGLVAVTDDTTNSEIDLNITGGTNGQILKTVGTTPTWSSDADTYLRSQLTQKWGDYALTSPTGGSGIFTDYLSSVGTHSMVIAANTGARSRWETGAVAGDQAGIRTNTHITIPTNNPRLQFRIGGYSSTNALVFVGFTSLSGAFPTPPNTNPLQDLHGIGLWVNTANTNVRCIHNDGAGASVQEDLSSTTTVASGGIHLFDLYTDDLGVTWHLKFDGTDNVNSTEIPGTTVNLAAIAYTETQSATLKAFDIRGFEFRGKPA